MTEDTLLNGSVRLFQPLDGLRATLDSVFLASAVAALPGQRVLELGCGSGAVSMCLAHRIKEIRIVGLEIDRALARLSQDNAHLNKFSDRFEAVVGDLVKPPPRLAPHSFDHVIANPPYFEPGKNTLPTGMRKAKAHTEGIASLESWVTFAVRMSKPGGTLTFIHRSERLAELLALMSTRTGGILIYPLWSHDPFTDKSKGAKRVIIQARVGQKGALQLLGGLVLHDADGQYTPESQAILRNGDALNWVRG